MSPKYVTRSKQGIKSLVGGVAKAKHTALVTVTTRKTMTLTYYSTETYHGSMDVRDLALGHALVEAKSNEWVDGGTKVELTVDTEDLSVADKAVA